MKRAGLLWLVAGTCSVLINIRLEAQAPQCPPGQIWSGETCVIHYYCKNGQPLLPGGSCGKPSSNEPNQRPPNSGVMLPHLEEPPCSRKAQFFKRVRAAPKGRTVLLSNGSAETLFERYVEDSGTANTDLELKHLRIVLVERTRGYVILVAPRLKIGEMFKFLTPHRLWLRELKGLWAKKILNPEREALRLQADLVCGPNTAVHN